jgi:hypothetical protein
VSASIEIDARRDFTVLSPDRRVNHTQQQHCVVNESDHPCAGAAHHRHSDGSTKGMDLM